jgi:hypothetical protein
MVALYGVAGSALAAPLQQQLLGWSCRVEASRVACCVSHWVCSALSVSCTLRVALCNPAWYVRRCGMHLTSVNVTYGKWLRTRSGVTAVLATMLITHRCVITTQQAVLVCQLQR